MISNEIIIKLLTLWPQFIRRMLSLQQISQLPVDFCRLVHWPLSSGRRQWLTLARQERVLRSGRVDLVSLRRQHVLRAGTGGSGWLGIPGQNNIKKIV